MSKTVEKALRVLCAFGGDVPECGLTDIAHSLKYDKATVSRLLKTLEQFGLVMVNPRSRKYRLGPRVLELAGRFNLQRDLRSIALPEMVRIRNLLGETVGLSFPLLDGRVCTEQVESLEHVRAVMPIGQILPYHAGSVGRVMLAHKPWREIERILKGPLTAFSENTITDVQRLRDNLAEVRRNGYAISLGERLLGSCGISVPLLNHQREVLSALTVIGPVSRFSAERAKAFFPSLKEAASRITSDLMGPVEAAAVRG